MPQPSIKNILLNEIKLFFHVKESDRPWHLAFLAAISIGIPLLVGVYFDNMKMGLLASVPGLVVLYVPSSKSLVTRMATMLICSFGFMFCYTLGLFFNGNFLISTLFLGVFSVIIHWVNLYVRTKPPGSFFFILLAALSSNMPHNLKEIPERVGLIAMGTMLSCCLALAYSILIRKKDTKHEPSLMSSLLERNSDQDLIEALIVGGFMFGSMLIGHLLQLQNPYWIPISCLAVMQGVSLYHVWRRVIYRITGTFLGLGLCWIILSVVKTPLSICLVIIVFQFIIEVLVVRNYAFAVIFITPMTILLAEAASPSIHKPDVLILARFIDISVGSLLGAIGGWFLYNEKMRYYTTSTIRKARWVIKKR